MDVRLIEATPEDRPRIERWLHAEHVRRYWGEPGENRELLREATEAETRALIEVDGRKVGLVAWQHPSRQELDEAGLPDVPESAIDLDLMIGERDCLGRGIATEAIRLVAERALEDPGVPFVIAAVMNGNAASLRAFAKAGFRPDREFDDPVAGRCVLFVRDRREA